MCLRLVFADWILYASSFYAHFMASDSVGDISIVYIETTRLILGFSKQKTWT